VALTTKVCVDPSGNIGNLKKGGEDCIKNTECNSGECTFFHCEALISGQPCSFNSQCANNRCDGVIGNRKCSESLVPTCIKAGEACATEYGVDKCNSCCTFPKYRIAKVDYCGPKPVTPTAAPIAGSCIASGGIPTLINGEKYCQSPYIFGSREWVCENGKRKVIERYLFTKDCKSDLPDIGEKCTTSGGWPGTCTYNSGCDQGKEGVAYDLTPGICKLGAGGCCGYEDGLTTEPTAIPTSVSAGKECKTTQGWEGTCTQHDLIQCNYSDSAIAWDGTVSPCKAVSGYGCCGKNPIVSKTCRTTEGWEGTCTHHDLLKCNYAAGNIVWDNTVSACKANDITDYGCCGKQPGTEVPTVVPTTIPTVKPCECVKPQVCVSLGICRAEKGSAGKSCGTGLTSVCCTFPIEPTRNPTQTLIPTPKPGTECYCQESKCGTQYCSWGQYSSGRPVSSSNSCCGSVPLVPTSIPTLSPVTPETCKECPREFRCYKGENSDEFKWFVDGYVMDGFVLANSDLGEDCETAGISRPTFKGKGKGDADCNGYIDTIDFSLWHKEFFDGDKGATVKPNYWNADFTGSEGKCDDRVDTYDFSLWQKFFSELNNGGQ